MPIVAFGHWATWAGAAIAGDRSISRNLTGLRPPGFTTPRPQLTRRVFAELGPLAFASKLGSRADYGLAGSPFNAFLRRVWKTLPADRAARRQRAAPSSWPPATTRFRSTMRGAALLALA